MRGVIYWVVLMVLVMRWVWDREETVYIDCSDTAVMKRFAEDEEAKEVLFWYLCASREWEVGRVGGIPFGELASLDIVARRRGDGVCVGFGNRAFCRVKMEYRTPAGARRGVMRVERGEGRWMGGTLFLIAASDLTRNVYVDLGVEVRGRGGEEELRKKMKSFKGECMGMFKMLWERREEIREGMEGVGGMEALKILPEGSYKVMEKGEVEVKEGGQRGVYRIKGYVNGGEKGCVYWRVVEKDGRVDAYPGDHEYVGWCGEERVKFFFDFGNVTMGGRWDRKREVRVEVVFRNERGEEKVVASKVCEVYGWRR